MPFNPYDASKFPGIKMRKHSKPPTVTLDVETVKVLVTAAKIYRSAQTNAAPTAVDKAIDIARKALEGR